MKRRLARESKSGLMSPSTCSPLHKKLCNLSQTEYKTHDSLEFKPTAFRRCHSRNPTDSADVGTQVWQCAFEPDVNDPDKHTNFVATCGGNSFCVIDVKSLSKSIFGKFISKDAREMFYALCWTTLIGENGSENNNILAVGGALGIIHLLINPTMKSVQPLMQLSKHKILLKKHSKTHINSLLFSKSQQNILFCSLNDGQVEIYDIGSVKAKSIKNITLIHTLQANSEIFDLTLSVNLNILLAAGNEGLFGWELPTEMSASMNRPATLSFHFPTNQLASESNTKLVDSTQVLEGNLVATKCALHGVIYIWDLMACFIKKSKESEIKFKVLPLHTLEWSNTDNYFMSMGYSHGAHLLACGDDKGQIWLYDLTSLNTDSKGLCKASSILAWPCLDDPYIAQKRKLSLDVYDIVVDKVNIDYQGKHLVAVTANNTVCIWKRTTENQTE